jgi:cell division protein FtsB
MRRRDRKKVVVISICVFFALISIPRLKNLVTHYRKLQYYNTEIIRLQEENEALREKIRIMEDEPYYTEKMLRENHGYVKESEYIYRINENKEK